MRNGLERSDENDERPAGNDGKAQDGSLNAAPERKAIRSTSIACVGGNSRVCLGSFLMPKDETAESKKAFIEDVKAKSMGGGRVDLYEVLAERILPAIKWAESKGAQCSRRLGA